MPRDTATHSPVERPGISEYPTALVAWLTVALLFIAYIISFVDRMIIGLLVEPMKKDLQLTDTAISLLHGFAFAIFYSLAGIPIGRLIDRSSRTRLVAAGMLLWSGMTMLCGFASQYWQLFVCRIGVGVGEATLAPAAYSIISDSFPPRRLGVAMGVFVLGSVLGAGLALLFGAALISLVAYSDEVVLPVVGTVRVWQAAFLIVGLPGILLAPAFIALRDPGRQMSGATDAATATMRDVLRFCRSRIRPLLGIALGIGCINICVFATVSWLPAFYVRAHGFTLADAGYTAAVALIAGGLIGYLGGGRICDKLGGGEPQHRLYFGATAAATGLVSGALFALVESPLVATILYVISFIAMTAPTGAAVSALQQITPGHHRATISAGYLLIVNVVGMTVGPTLTALIGDTFFPQADGIRYAIAIVTPLGFVGSAALLLMAARAVSRPLAP
ncbi:MAG: MFS transporter [Steroidobacteraceae bacterium]|jgi:MFS family permease